MPSLWYIQWGIFLILWLSYAASYFLRKPISVVKAGIKEDLDLTTSQLGWLDVALLLPYAISSLLFGKLVDKYGPKETLSCSLLLASAATFPIVYCESILPILMLLAISGAAQALCWPCACKIIVMWFPKDMVNTVYGIYGSSLLGGGFSSAIFAVYIQSVYGWKYVFPSCALVAATVGMAVLLFIPKSNQHYALEVGINSPTTDTADDIHTAVRSGLQLTLKEIILLPLVAELSFSQFCMKAVRYSLMMWLPLYLFQVFGYSKEVAGVSSTAFEVGGLIGSVLSGIIIDQMMSGRAALTCCLLSSLAAVALILTTFMAAISSLHLIICLVFVGAFTCAPANIITTTLCTEVGGTYQATSAVIGVVNGFAVLGTVLEGPAVGITAEKLGWDCIFPLMVLLCLLGAVTSLRIHRTQRQ